MMAKMYHTELDQWRRYDFVTRKAFLARKRKMASQRWQGFKTGLPGLFDRV